MKKNRLAVLIITPCIAAALIVGTVAVINSGAFDASKLVEGTTAITMTATSAETTADLKETVETEPTAVQTTVTAITTTVETTSATIETTAPVTTTSEAMTTTPPETTTARTERTERTFTPEESAAMSEVAELEKQVRQQAVSAAANTTAATTTEYTVETTATTTASTAPKPDDADYEKNGVYYKCKDGGIYEWYHSNALGWIWSRCGEGKVDYLDPDVTAPDNWDEDGDGLVDWLH